jgi:hypothetical protein
LYLKKGILAGMQAAQICLSEEEMPKFLLPIMSRMGTVRPMKTPATDQCQGCFINSNMFLFILV